MFIGWFKSLPQGVSLQNAMNAYETECQRRGARAYPYSESRPPYASEASWEADCIIWHNAVQQLVQDNPVFSSPAVPQIPISGLNIADQEEARKHQEAMIATQAAILNQQIWLQNHPFQPPAGG